MKLIVLKNHLPLDEVSVTTTDPSESYEIYVGRSEDCHVLIDDPLISRHHFVLKNEGTSWYCEKLTQLGVISINGVLVTKNPVANGDEIKCGAYSIIVTELLNLVQDQTIAEMGPTLEELAPELGPVAEPVTEIIESPMPEEDLPIEDAPSEEAEELVADEFLDESSDLRDEYAPASEEEGLGDLNTFDSGTEEPFGESELPAESVDFGAEASEEPEFGEMGDTGDEFGMITTDEDQNESTRFFKAFVNYQLVLFGEHAPYDRFQIDQDEIFIGRDQKKCQIILNDPEVSSVHAVIRKTNVEITLEDLNSSNGTILNGERINKSQITAGDEFVIGGTSFTLEVRSDLLESESDRLMPVEANQVVETEEIIEEEILDDGDLNFDSEAPPEKSLFKRFRKDPAFRKKVIVVAAIVSLGVIFLLPSEEEPPKKKAAPKTAKVEDQKNKLNLSKEKENERNVSYELGVNYFEQSRYDLAKLEFEKVMRIDPDYKKIKTYLEQTEVALKRIQELEEQKRAEEERIRVKKIIDELLIKARAAVKERQVQVAESYFAQIIEKDPENIEVSQLKLELEAWQKEEERKAFEKAAQEAARKKMVDGLSPGKTFYLKKEWYRAILKLEDFLRIKGTDEDLVKDASDMLSDAKNQLASELGPLLGKARSLKEGQDLKAAYEAFLEILRIEPTNAEALNEVDEIKSLLDSRSKKIYREAIIAESLSLFNDAKEKFLEVQQISPTDSEYYKKASEKLKNYLE